MRVVGLIVEYNPFHNGHLYHLQQAKKITNADYVVAVMSGDFLQRGMPAIMDKWERTHMAIDNGVDLVIQLPTFFSTGSAEFFARGAIEILNRLGIVDTICFGSECGQVDLLKEIASVLVNEPPFFKESLMKHLGTGLSFPNARSKALVDYFSFIQEDHLELIHVLNSPNNILGIEYIKSLIESKSTIMPYTFKRKVSGYHDKSMEQNIASATGIRHFLNESNALQDLMHTVPKATYRIMNQYHNKKFPLFIDDFSSYLFYKLLNASPKDLMKYVDVSEGLEDRILNYSKECDCITTLIDRVKTKRFTYTRIQRALIHILLDIEQNDLDYYMSYNRMPYIKLLGFKKDSQRLLKSIKNNCDTPIVSNVNKGLQLLTTPALKMINKDIYASNLYNLAVFNKFKYPLKNDQTQKFIIK
ncbi:putative nucleotidyltransferase [Natranaerovirga hydrolytica]|uniref:tRNA(Met) cytidine acetate ligase n=1 Tax=Natranaerovirga hydrolytica TaxID=680378 RepID=A0A4R1N5P6_9FIRM|nr:nucleotidyltransferase [Natranaerovirga hydrolytica]TCK98319.1 putative nucleotidyltransferase [Natranaerovirga hydrolytica]